MPWYHAVSYTHLDVYKRQNVDDIVETTNHFRCIDLVIDDAKNLLSEKMIKELHLILKNGTQDSRKEWFAVGYYKKVPNEVGGHDTALPEEVPEKMKNLLARYRKLNEKTQMCIRDSGMAMCEQIKRPSCI